MMTFHDFMLDSSPLRACMRRREIAPVNACEQTWSESCTAFFIGQLRSRVTRMLLQPKQRDLRRNSPL